MSATPGPELPAHVVIWAYRLILGRDAESKEVIRQWQSLGDAPALVRHFMDSAEFRQTRAGRGLAPESLVPPDAEALDAWHWLRHGRPAPREAGPVPPFLTLREALLHGWETLPEVPPDAVLVEVDGRPHWVRGVAGDPYLRHAPNEAAMLQRLVRLTRALLPDGGEGAVLLDGGANLGLSALAMAAGAPRHARLLAIEPNPRLSALLRDNLARNGLARAEIHQAALVAIPGEVLLHDPASASVAFVTAAENGVGSGARHVVPGVTLDELVRPLARLDLVKLDIEGSETQAIKGGLRSLRRLRTAVYVELNIWTQMRFAGVNPLRVIETWAKWFPHVVHFTEAGPRPVEGVHARSKMVHDILMSPGRHDDIVLCFDLDWVKRWV